MKLLADDPAIRSRARDPPNESFSSSPSKPERRSTRLSYNNYPLGLHTLLKKGWLPSEVDEIAIRQVRDGGKDKTINEELAAQIHCLHGVRKFSLETSKTQRIGNGDLAVDVQGKGKEKCGKQSRRDSFSSFSSQEDESDSQASLAEKSISSKVGDDGTFPALPLFGPHDANQVQPSQTIITDGLLGTQAQVQVHAQPGGMAEDDNEQATPEPAPWYDFVAPDAQRAASYNLGSKNGGIGDSRLRTKARERVYDASRYSYENGWGPFKAWRESEESWRRRKEEGSDAVGVKEKYIKGKEKAAEVAENIEDESDEEDFVGVGTSEEEEIQTEEEGEENDEDGDSLRREVQREFSITPAATLASPPPVSHASSSNGTRALPSLASVLDFAVAASMENYDSEDDPDFQPEAATPPTLNIDPTVSTNPDLILDAGDPEEDELSMMQIFQDNSDGEEIVVEEDDFFDDGDTDSDDEEAFGGLHIGHFGQTRQTLRDWAGSRVREELGGKIQKSQAQVKEKGKGKERAIEREGSDGLMKFQKTIDWQQLEAIMLVTYTNLQSALREGWGRGFDLPIGVYGDQSANPPPKFPSSIPQDGVKTKGQLQDEADQLDLIKKFERRRRLLIPRSDFENSRGEILLDEEIREDQEKRNENDEMTESLGSNKDVKGSQNRGKGKEKEIKEEKPKDWAHVEGVHVGTYSFLDFSDFLIFNAALGSQAEEAAVAAQSSCQETGSSSQASSSINPRSWLRSNTASLSIMRQAITLEGKEEAVGDCLNLELELLPLSSQPGFEKDEDGFKSKTPDEQIEDDLVGKDDRYPPLRFKGRTLTQNGLTSIPRGEAHGLVRPIYAPGERIGGSSNASSSPREIVGIHWTVVHRYESV